jgi:hypothetical protein
VVSTIRDRRPPGRPVSYEESLDDALWTEDGKLKEEAMGDGVGEITVDEILATFPEVREHPGLMQAEPVIYRKVTAVREEDGTLMPHHLEEEYLGFLNAWGYFMVDGNGSPWDGPDPHTPMVVGVLWPGTEKIRRVQVLYGHPDDTFIRPGAERNWVARPGWYIGSPAVVAGVLAIAPGDPGHLEEEWELCHHLLQVAPERLKLPQNH